MSKGTKAFCQEPRSGRFDFAIINERIITPTVKRAVLIVRGGTVSTNSLTMIKFVDQRKGTSIRYKYGDRQLILRMLIHPSTFDCVLPK